MYSRYKSLCRGLAKLVLVLGIIGSIILAASCGVVKDISYSVYSGISTSTERNAELTIVLFLSGLLGTSILYAMLAGLSEVLQYLEMLSQKNEKQNIKETDDELPPL